MKKILWIEDDIDIITPTKLLLEHEGWQVYNAYSVDDGRTIANEIIPDLIIIDIIIDIIMDGRHCCTGIKSLRSVPKLSDVPIIIYTSFTKRWGDTIAKRRDALITEAKEFIEKSAGPEVLIKTIQKYLKSDS